MKETVCFQISGEWITQTARDWFFKDKKDYSKSEELILSCCNDVELSEKEKKDLAKDIIEGRYKFVGINTLNLEEDNKNIRSIFEEMKDREKNLKMQLLKKDIKERPFMYLDRFSLKQSIDDFLTEKNNSYLSNLEEIIKYFGENIDDYTYIDPFLKNGLYVILEPDKWVEMLYNTIKSETLSSFDYSDKKVERSLTEYWNTVLVEWKCAGKTYSNMSSFEKRVYERQLIACDFFSMNFPYGDIFSMSNVKNIKNNKKKIDKLDIAAIEKLKESFDFREYKPEHKVNWDFFVKENFDLNYIGIADNVFHSKWGLIDPLGHWFSCDFGGHTVKATAIISANKTLAEEFINWLFERELLKNEHSKDFLLKNIFHCSMMVGMDKAIEFLMQNKWCKVSNTAGGTPIPVVEDEIRGLTKAQEKTYFENKIFFKGLKNVE